MLKKSRLRVLVVNLIFEPLIGRLSADGYTVVQSIKQEQFPDS